MLDFYQFFSPTRIVGGTPGFLAQLGPELEDFRGRKVGVVTDWVIEKLGLLDTLQASLQEVEIATVATFSDVPQDSDVAVVEDVAHLFQDAGVNLLLAMGGGSVIDTAKAVNIVLTHGGDLRDCQGAQVLTKPLLPLIVVPTTVGTGSEVTMVSVVVDRADRRKLTFVDRAIAPALAVLDPAVTFTLPPSLVATTAMDALTHALEAFIDLEHSPFSDAWAVAAASLIRQNLLPALNESGFEEARANLQIASTMAGVAFNHSMVGIVHALAHSLGGVAGVPHGLANTLMLCEGLQSNLDAAANRMSEIGLRAGFLEQSRGDDFHDGQSVIQSIREFQQQVVELAGLPRNLKQAGVTEGQLQLLVERASEDGTLVYNPKVVEPEEILQMYMNMMGE